MAENLLFTVQLNIFAVSLHLSIYSVVYLRKQKSETVNRFLILLGVAPAYAFSPSFSCNDLAVKCAQKVLQLSPLYWKRKMSGSLFSSFWAPVNHRGKMTWDFPVWNFRAFWETRKKKTKTTKNKTKRVFGSFTGRVTFRARTFLGTFQKGTPGGLFIFTFRKALKVYFDQSQHFAHRDHCTTTVLFRTSASDDKCIRDISYSQGFLVPRDPRLKTNDHWPNETKASRKESSPRKKGCLICQSCTTPFF